MVDRDFQERECLLLGRDDQQDPAPPGPTGLGRRLIQQGETSNNRTGGGGGPFQINRILPTNPFRGESEFVLHPFDALL